MHCFVFKLYIIFRTAGRGYSAKDIVFRKPKMYNRVMKNFLIDVLNTSIVLFIIIDFLGSIPIFVGLLRDMSKQEKKKTINLAVIVSFIILLFFPVIGVQIFKLFGISIVEFKIGGGLLLLIVALDEVFGLLPKRENPVEDVGIVPIASPLLAGPGAITTAIIVMQKLEFPANYLVILLSVIIVMFVIWVMFLNMEFINRILGKRGCLVLSRIMGIILTAIAVNYIMSGIKNILS
jgi:multiple antibiotic resistance protein